MFDDPLKLVLGLLTGICFGFLLQKGQVAKFQTMLGQLLLKDYTVFKTMATAIAVGTIGVHVLIAMGWASPTVQPASLARLLIGGSLFGIGMAIFGLCPGTSVAARRRRTQGCHRRRSRHVCRRGNLCGSLRSFAARPQVDG